MAKRGQRFRSASEGGINMTPMIDIVFQMIIFFITTVQLEKDAVNEAIMLAMAPHGPAVVTKDPMEVTIDVDHRGRIEVGRTPLSPRRLEQVLLKARAQYYPLAIPVVVRGDGKTKHEDVKKVMDACSRAKIWKIKFAAVKDPAKKVRRR